MEKQNAAPDYSYSKPHKSLHTDNKQNLASEPTYNKAMQNEMTERNTFQHVAINISILQGGVWVRWEESRSIFIFYLILSKNKKNIEKLCLFPVFCQGSVLQNAEQPQLSESAGLLRAFSTLQNKHALYCIAFINTNTCFSNQ